VPSRAIISPSSASSVPRPKSPRSPSSAKLTSPSYFPSSSASMVEVWKSVWWGRSSPPRSRFLRYSTCSAPISVVSMGIGASGSGSSPNDPLSRNPARVTSPAARDGQTSGLPAIRSIAAARQASEETERDGHHGGQREEQAEGTGLRQRGGGHGSDPAPCEQAGGEE